MDPRERVRHWADKFKDYQEAADSIRLSRMTLYNLVGSNYTPSLPTIAKLHHSKVVKFSAWLALPECKKW